MTGTYYEPFLGSGAVFFELNPTASVLSDINPQLIDCFEAVRDNPDKVIQSIWHWSNTCECYYRVRRIKPRTKVWSAAQLIYLTRTAWGGLYRINKKGEFNVPFGNSGRKICSSDGIQRCSTMLQNTILMCNDFQNVIEMAGENDVVYADPPYTSVGQNNGFRRYNEHLFAWKDQERLSKVCKKAVRSGVFVIVSGVWHPDVIKLYKNWWAVKVRRASNVSRKVEFRKRVNEILLFSKKPKMLTTRWCQSNIVSVEKL